jgi:hypothetical protein
MSAALPPQAIASTSTHPWYHPLRESLFELAYRRSLAPATKSAASTTMPHRSALKGSMRVTPEADGMGKAKQQRKVVIPHSLTPQLLTSLNKLPLPHSLGDPDSDAQSRSDDAVIRACAQAFAFLAAERDLMEGPKSIKKAEKVLLGAFEGFKAAKAAEQHQDVGVEAEPELEDEQHEEMEVEFTAPAPSLPVVALQHHLVKPSRAETTARPTRAIEPTLIAKPSRLESAAVHIETDPVEPESPRSPEFPPQKRSATQPKRVSAPAAPEEEEEDARMENSEASSSEDSEAEPEPVNDETDEIDMTDLPAFPAASSSSSADESAHRSRSLDHAHRAARRQKAVNEAAQQREKLRRMEEAKQSNYGPKLKQKTSVETLMAISANLQIGVGSTSLMAPPAFPTAAASTVIAGRALGLPPPHRPGVAPSSRAGSAAPFASLRMQNVIASSNAVGVGAGAGREALKPTSRALHLSAHAHTPVGRIESLGPSELVKVWRKKAKRDGAEVDVEEIRREKEAEMRAFELSHPSDLALSSSSSELHPSREWHAARSHTGADKLEEGYHYQEGQVVKSPNHWMLGVDPLSGGIDASGEPTSTNPYVAEHRQSHRYLSAIEREWLDPPGKEGAMQGETGGITLRVGRKRDRSQIDVMRSSARDQLRTMESSNHHGRPGSISATRSSVMPMSAAAREVSPSPSILTASHLPPPRTPSQSRQRHLMQQTSQHTPQQQSHSSRSMTSSEKASSTPAAVGGKRSAQMLRVVTNISAGRHSSNLERALSGSIAASPRAAQHNPNDTPLARAAAAASASVGESPLILSQKPLTTGVSIEQKQEAYLTRALKAEMAKYIPVEHTKYALALRLAHISLSARKATESALHPSEAWDRLRLHEFQQRHMESAIRNALREVGVKDAMCPSPAASNVNATLARTSALALLPVASPNLAGRVSPAVSHGTGLARIPPGIFPGEESIAEQQHLTSRTLASPPCRLSGEASHKLSLNQLTNAAMKGLDTPASEAVERREQGRGADTPATTAEARRTSDIDMVTPLPRNRILAWPAPSAGLSASQQEVLHRSHSVQSIAHEVSLTQPTQLLLSGSQTHSAAMDLDSPPLDVLVDPTPPMSTGKENAPPANSAAAGGEADAEEASRAVKKQRLSRTSSKASSDRSASSTDASENSTRRKKSSRGQAKSTATAETSSSHGSAEKKQQKKQPLADRTNKRSTEGARSSRK